jgi:acyl dehydratase
MTNRAMVPPEARAMVGQQVGRTQGVVRRSEFQRWAAAAGDLNPVYFDAGQARACGYRDVVMPPLFLRCVGRGAAALTDLRPDGTVIDRDVTEVPLNCTQRMAGGETTEFHGPLYPGDTVTATTTLAGVTEKAGRSGPFVLVTWRVEYVNQHGALVAETFRTMIAK